MASPTIDHASLHPTASKFFTEVGNMPSLDEVPTFLKQGLDMNKVRQVVTPPTNDNERNAVSAVDGKDPYTIQVYDKGLYDKDVQHHELTHTYQDTRNPALRTSADIKTPGDPREYDYGGLDGLVSAQKNKKTISDFNYEQQAEIVKDYKSHHDQYLAKAAKGKITPADEKAMYKLQQAYHPFIKQLASQPGKNVNLDRNSLLELVGIQKPAEIRENPPAPGLPSYDTPGLGVLPADPLMGGKSQDTSKHSVDKSKLHPKAQKFFSE